MALVLMLTIVVLLLTILIAAIVILTLRVVILALDVIFGMCLGWIISFALKTETTISPGLRCDVWDCTFFLGTGIFSPCLNGSFEGLLRFLALLLEC